VIVETYFVLVGIIKNRMAEMSNQPPLPSSPPPHQQQQQQEHETAAGVEDAAATANDYQGILYKRRDVFKRRWNPRWFVLEASEGVLTYYRVRSSSAAAAAAATTAPPTVIDVSQRSQTPPPLLQHSDHDHDARPLTMTPTLSPIRSSGGMAVTRMPLLRNRSNSFDSNDSSEGSSGSYDDAVPRGTIHIRGCTILRNDALSRPEENYFVFTIQRPLPSSASSGSAAKSLHLAARTQESRTEWIHQLQQVVVSTASDPATAAAAAASTGHHQCSPPKADNDDDATPPPIPHHRDPSNTPTASLVSPNTAWRCLDDDSRYAQLPDSLRKRLQSLLDDYLPLCEQDISCKEYGWQKLVPLRQEKNGNTIMAVQRKQPDGSMLLRGDAVLPNTSPWALLSLLMDPSRKMHMETTVRCAQRLHVYNPHTFLDMHAYHAVWPTAAREFTVCAHWPVLHRFQNDNNNNGGGNDKEIQAKTGDMLPAILTCSFSCPEAEAAQGPVTPNHVRGNLLVSMFLLQPLSSSTSSSTTTVGCRLTRLASIDLGGSVSQSLSNTVLTKQANLPAVLAAYLESSSGGNKSTPLLAPTPLSSSWSNAIVSEQILKPILGDAFVQSTNNVTATTSTANAAAAAGKVLPAARRRRESTTTTSSSSSPPNSSGDDDDVVHGGGKGSVVETTHHITETRSSTGTASYSSLAVQAVVVYVPVGYYMFLEFGSLIVVVLLFCLSGLSTVYRQLKSKSC